MRKSRYLEVGAYWDWINLKMPDNSSVCNGSKLPPTRPVQSSITGSVLWFGSGSKRTTTELEVWLCRPPPDEKPRRRTLVKIKRIPALLLSSLSLIYTDQPGQSYSIQFFPFFFASIECASNKIKRLFRLLLLYSQGTRTHNCIAPQSFLIETATISPQQPRSMTTIVCHSIQRVIQLFFRYFAPFLDFLVDNIFLEKIK